MTAQCLLDYGMKPVAAVRIVNNEFQIEITDADACKLERCIYAFLIGDVIVRIGSSKARLSIRLNAWERDVTSRLMEDDSSTPQWEADGWREHLAAHGVGQVFARQGTNVKTPIGEFPAYLDEESILIGRHEPPLNGSKHR